MEAVPSVFVGLIDSIGILYLHLSEHPSFDSTMMQIARTPDIHDTDYVC
jgi:hypothetical protein